MGCIVQKGNGKPTAITNTHWTFCMTIVALNNYSYTISVET